MRFATFNVSSGRSLTDGRVDAGRFADAVAALDVDVLSMQEVDRGQARSGGLDLTAIAAEAMGTEHAVFAPAIHGTPGSRWTAATDEPQDGPAYGCALVSRTPLRDVEVFRIPALPVVLPLWIPGKGVLPVREEPRVAIIARVGSPTDGVTVIATHLPFVPGWNRRWLGRLVAHLRDRPGPVLLLGDLNLGGAAAARITGYRQLATHLTYPAPKPRLQLDHVLLRGDLADLGTAVRTSASESPVSDHRPLVVDVDRPHR